MAKRTTEHESLVNGMNRPSLAYATPLAVLALGVLTIGTGGYFMLARPPLLPEDAQFTGVAVATAPPALLHWLSIVFRTWGGFVVGLGFCLVGLATYCFTRRDAWLKRGAAMGVLIAFGSFLGSNIQLHSDFLWFVSALSAVAVAAAVLLATDRSREDGPRK